MGYKVGIVTFGADGEPVDASTSTTALTDIFTNKNNSVCPGNCTRPAGLVFDTQGRLFISSDASGEIYILTKTTTGNGTSSSGSGNSTSTGSSPTQTGVASASLAVGWYLGAVGFLVASLVVF